MIRVAFMMFLILENLPKFYLSALRDESKVKDWNGDNYTDELNNGKINNSLPIRYSALFNIHSIHKKPKEGFNSLFNAMENTKLSLDDDLFKEDRMVGTTDIKKRDNSKLNHEPNYPFIPMNILPLKANSPAIGRDRHQFYPKFNNHLPISTFKLYNNSNNGLPFLQPGIEKLDIPLSMPPHLEHNEINEAMKMIKPKQLNYDEFEGLDVIPPSRDLVPFPNNINFPQKEVVGDGNYFDAGSFESSTGKTRANNNRKPPPNYVPFEQSNNVRQKIVLKPSFNSVNGDGFDNADDKFPEAVYDRVGNVQVYCDFMAKEMSVDINFLHPFNGVVYTKGYFKGESCKGFGKGGNALRFIIPLDGCGTLKKEQVHSYSQIDQNDDYGKRVFENIVVIMFEPNYGILNNNDKVYGLKCKESMVGTKRINTGFTIPRTDVTQIAPYTSNVPDVYMKIIKGKNPYEQATDILQLGDIATVAVNLPGYPDYDMYLFDCMAHDGLNYGKIRLNDENGCPIDHNLVSSQSIYKTKDIMYTQPGIKQNSQVNTNTNKFGNTAYFNFKTFKFPDVEHVYFDCFANICYQKCPNRPEMMCNKRIKKRHALNGTKLFNDTVTQFKKVSLFQGVKVILKGEEITDEIEQIYKESKKKISCSCYNGLGYVSTLTIILLVLIVFVFIALIMIVKSNIDGPENVLNSVFLRKMNKVATHYFDNSKM